MFFFFQLENIGGPRRRQCGWRRQNKKWEMNLKREEPLARTLAFLWVAEEPLEASEQEWDVTDPCWVKGTKALPPWSSFLRILIFSSLLRKSTQKTLLILPTFLPRDSDWNTYFRGRIRMFIWAWFNYMWPIGGLRAGSSLLATPHPTASQLHREHSPALQALLSSL